LCIQGWNWNLIKGSRAKIKNQNNDDQSWNSNKWEDKSKILNSQCEFRVKKREKKKKLSSPKPLHTLMPLEESVVMLSISSLKLVFSHQITSHAQHERCERSHTLVFFLLYLIFVKIQNCASIKYFIIKKN
jgi:hypothetical protein